MGIVQINEINLIVCNVYIVIARILYRIIVRIYIMFNPRAPI